MAKPQKLKRYQQSSMTSRKGGLRGFAMFVGILLAAGLLVWLGMVIYAPVSDFIMNLGQADGTSSLAELLEELSQPAEGEEQEEPEPETPQAQQAGNLHMAYLPLETAKNSTALDTFLTNMQSSDMNTVLLDVKDNLGMLHYKTSNTLALEWGAQADNPLDLSILRQTLEEKGMNFAVRMAAFSDPIAARGDRENNAIHYQSSEMLWLDNFADQGGKPWLNPYSIPSKAYLTDIAVELAELGAVMVVLDGVQFPDDAGTYAVYGTAAQSISRLEALKAFTQQVSQALEEKGVRTAVYLSSTALTQSQSENRYGTINPLEITEGEVLLGVLPGPYGSGYSEGGLTLEAPGENPAATVGALLSFCAEKAGHLQNLIPLMLGGNEGEGQIYTADQLTAQVEAASTAGWGEYAFYSADGEYVIQ